jgi:hypothetical protein
LIAAPVPFLIAAAMEPNEALGIAAQVAVTLAGFAGSVVVFLPESVRQWSRVDRFRLRLLLTIKPAPDSIWQWCSAFAAVFPGAVCDRKFQNSAPLWSRRIQRCEQILVLSIVCDRSLDAFAATLQHRSAELGFGRS